MALTPLDIQQQRFRIGLRGYATKEVETFLEQTANGFEDLQREVHRLADENKKLQFDVEEHQRREGTFKRALLHSQKVLDQMQENARRQADVIVAEAEGKAEKLLQHAQNRVAELQDSIAALKRQRIQVEEEIMFVIETHRRMLEAGRESARESDEYAGKLKVLKSAK
ncbi:MAG: DivIVA domain-containing protein [Desulfobacterales bacterium]|nr:DivIVA domain-containing protein [Desulfobacterales bacterium]